MNLPSEVVVYIQISDHNSFLTLSYDSTAFEVARSITYFNFEATEFANAGFQSSIRGLSQH